MEDLSSYFDLPTRLRESVARLVLASVISKSKEGKIQPSSVLVSSRRLGEGTVQTPLVFGSRKRLMYCKTGCKATVKDHCVNG